MGRKKNDTVLGDLEKVIKDLKQAQEALKNIQKETNNVPMWGWLLVIAPWCGMVVLSIYGEIMYIKMKEMFHKAVREDLERDLEKE
jgi:uncharacterized membrane protein YjjP (DUF1212 family)